MLDGGEDRRMEQIRHKMIDWKNNTGWIVALWGWLVSHCPTAHDLLVYLSIVVAVLQLFVLIAKIYRGGGDE